jgi:hypothetical protein
MHWIIYDRGLAKKKEKKIRKPERDAHDGHLFFSLCNKGLCVKTEIVKVPLAIRFFPKYHHIQHILAVGIKQSLIFGMASKGIGEKTAGFADLVRSRLRATILPLGLISLFGMSVYMFFSSLSIYTPQDGGQMLLEQQQHPHFKIDGLGRVGWTDPMRAGGMIFEADRSRVTDELKAYEPAELMRLPILHRTSQDPFDPRNQFKPLRDSKAPWASSTPSGIMLINRLSRNRFPAPDSHDPSKGSRRPPLPHWPPAHAIKKKDPALEKPIPTYLIAGLNTSYIWHDRDRISQGQLPKIQWEGFDRPHWESHTDRANRLERQGWVRRGFQHVWEGYKARGWGHDELKPISGSVRCSCLLFAPCKLTNLFIIIIPVAVSRPVCWLGRYLGGLSVRCFRVKYGW